MKKSTLIKIVGLAAGMTLIAPAVFAQTATSTSPVPSPANQMMINVTPSGRAQLRGTLVSVSGMTLMVASWGGNWTIDASNAKLVRRFGGISNFSEFAAGDDIQVQGIASQSGTWTIIAANVKDNSIQVKNVNVTGAISNIGKISSTQGFTLTNENGTAYQVTLNSDTKVYVNGQLGSFTSLINGIIVRVRGVLDRIQKTILATRIDYRQQTISVSGTISNINASSNSFTLTSSQGVLQVTLATNAVIRINNGAATFADLQNGMTASVRGFGDRSLMTITANRIQARFVLTVPGTSTPTKNY